MKDHYLMFAAYNAWANTILYKAVGELSDEQYRKECGAFFGSVHRTLNHVLVGDTIWMNRFQATSTNLKSVDAILHEDFKELRLARNAMDVRISEFFGGLGENELASNFTFQTIINSETVSQPLAPALANFFNHQTHHRGQLTTLVKQAGYEPGVTDLMWLPGVER